MNDDWWGDLDDRAAKIIPDAFLKWGFWIGIPILGGIAIINHFAHLPF